MTAYIARRHWVRDGRPGKSIVLAHDRGYHGLAGVTTTATRLDPYHADFGAAAPDLWWSMAKSSAASEQAK